MNLSPTPRLPEVAISPFENAIAPARPGETGIRRFEEGIASDTDVPSDFALGIRQGDPGPGGRNANVWSKSAEETTRQRAHLGSASWVEDRSHLGAFASEAFGSHGSASFVSETRDGGRYTHPVATIGR